MVEEMQVNSRLTEEQALFIEKKSKKNGNSIAAELRACVQKCMEMESKNKK